MVRKTTMIMFIILLIIRVNNNNSCNDINPQKGGDLSYANFHESHEDWAALYAVLIYRTTSKSDSKCGKYESKYSNAIT